MIAKEIDLSKVIRLKALLLDRDGVLNREQGHIRSVDEFQLLPGVGEAIAFFNQAGIKVIVVTNQSGLARGYLTETGLEKIHAKLEKELALEGASIDKIYVSPWLDQPGLPEGVEQYLKEHPDRKPSPGMILRALDDFNLKREEVCLVGDSGSDADAAERAGVEFFGVKSAKIAELKGTKMVFENLPEVLKYLLEEGRIPEPSP